MVMEINTAVDSGAHTGVSPYIVPEDVQSNPEDYGGPYTDMIGLLKQANIYLDRLVNIPQDLREQPRATQIFLNTTTPYSNTLHLRSTLLILTASAACSIGFVVGTGTQQSFNFGGPDTRVLPYITAIGPGVDLLLSTTAGTVSGYLIAYPAG